MSDSGKKQYFVGQREDEQVLYMSRRHWLPITVQFLRNIMLTLVWIVLVDTALIGFVYMTENAIASEFYTFLVFFSLIMFIPTISTTWVIYYLTLTVITDNRMIKITQKGVFYNYMRELKLRGLQDTSYTFKNWIQSMFNYGELVAHAASGEEGKFKVRYLPKPRAVHYYLNQLSQLLHNMEVKGVDVELPKFNDKQMWIKPREKHEKHEAPTNVETHKVQEHKEHDE